MIEVGNMIRFQMVESGSTITACKLLGDVPVSHQPDAEDFNLYVRTVGSKVSVDRSDTDETIVSAVGFDKAMIALANHYGLPVVITADYGVKVTKRAETMIGRYEPTTEPRTRIGNPDSGIYPPFYVGDVCEQIDRMGAVHRFVITAFVGDYVIFRDLTGQGKRGMFNWSSWWPMVDENRLGALVDHTDCVCDVITDAGAAGLPAGGRVCGGCGSVFTRSGEQASEATIAESQRVYTRNAAVSAPVACRMDGDGLSVGSALRMVHADPCTCDVAPVEVAPVTQPAMADPFTLTERHYAERLKAMIPAGTVLLCRVDADRVREWTVSRVTWGKVVLAERGVEAALEWLPSDVYGWLEAGDLKVVDTSLPFTSRDMTAQVIRALDGREAEFDVPWIVDRLQALHGTVDIDTIPSEDFWWVVRVHGSRDLRTGTAIIAELTGNANRMITAAVSTAIKPHLRSLLARRTRKASKRKASKVNRRRVRGGF